MRLSNFLFGSGIAVGLILLSRSLFFKPALTAAQLLRKIDVRCLAAKQSAELGLEKSSSSFLREIAQRLYDDLTHEYEQLRKGSLENGFYSSAALIESDTFPVDYDYNEESPFDLVYSSHQLRECDEIIRLLHDAAHLPDDSIKDIALRNLPIFLRYQSELNTFLENFLTLDDYRIRELAHQIWESEGRPEGQAARHWELAVKLSESISAADLQLAFEQKRSLVDLFSTSPFVQMPANKKPH